MQWAGFVSDLNQRFKLGKIEPSEERYWNIASHLHGAPVRCPQDVTKGQIELIRFKLDTQNDGWLNRKMDERFDPAN